MVKWWRIGGFIVLLQSITVIYRGITYYEFNNSAELIGFLIDFLIPFGIGMFLIFKPDFIPNTLGTFFKKSKIAKHKRK